MAEISKFTDLPGGRQGALPGCAGGWGAGRPTAPPASSNGVEIPQLAVFMSVDDAVNSLMQPDIKLDKLSNFAVMP